MSDYLDALFTFMPFDLSFTNKSCRLVNKLACLFLITYLYPLL